MNTFFLPPPRLRLVSGEAEERDESHVAQDGESLTTFDFLPSPPPDTSVHSFQGGVYFGQYTEGQTFDMSVESGGDFFAICGSKSFRRFTESFTARYSSVNRNLKRVIEYLPVEDPEYNGIFWPVETVEGVDEGSGLVRSRVVSATAYNVWEGQPEGGYRTIGGGVKSEPVTLGHIGSIAREWQDRTAQLAIANAGAVPWGAASFSATQTDDGAHAAFTAALSLTRSSAFEDDPPVSLLGVAVFHQFDRRHNQPVIYDPEGAGTCVGMRCYRTGRASRILSAEITAKKWKDAAGIFDATQEGLADTPWEASLNLARRHRAGYGGVSRGRFISIDGRKYRAILTEEPESGEMADLTIDPHATVEYHFEPADIEEIVIPWLHLQAWNGEEWIAEPAETVGANPGPGIGLIHSLKIRGGERWGHLPFIAPDPPPATPEAAVRYAKLHIVRTGKIS